jgi:hypothetical protein
MTYHVLAAAKQGGFGRLEHVEATAFLELVAEKIGQE